MAKNPLFIKVRDRSKRPVRGLYRRGPSLYGRLAIGGKLRQIRLLDKEGKPIPTDDITAAKAEMARLRAQGLPATLKKGTFAEVSASYLLANKNKKEVSTMEAEQYVARVLDRFFGSMQVASIKQADIEAFCTMRLAANKSKRTVNVNVVLLRAIFEHAIVQGMLRSNPTANIKSLRSKRKAVRWLPSQDILAVADWIRSNVKVGDLIADAILFLAFSGARFTGGMNVRWEDISFERAQVTINESKNKRPIFVDFNPDLAALLTRLRDKRRPKPTGLLFPSYRTPNEAEDKPLTAFRDSITKACAALGIERFWPHMLRHHFASRCVMAGINFKQVAEWLGHSDGGVLVSTTYGHLAKGFGQTAAQLLKPVMPPVQPPAPTQMAA